MKRTWVPGAAWLRPLVPARSRRGGCESARILASLLPTRTTLLAVVAVTALCVAIGPDGSSGVLAALAHAMPESRPGPVVPSSLPERHQDLVTAVRSRVSTEPQPLSPIQGSGAASSVGRLGLAHVDLMDLHVERLPDGGFRDRELLPAADLADRYAKAVQSGSGWNRWSLYWDMVERGEPATFDWRVTDGIVARDVTSGVRTLAILQGTPARYATGGDVHVLPPAVGGGPLSGRTPSLSMRLAASGFALSSSPPQSMDAPAFERVGGGFTDDPELAAQVNPGNPWARFVGAAVERYRPGGALALARGWPAGSGIRAWEIGNEPNLPHFWSGTSEQFSRYLEVAYLVIRFHDPDAVVMHGGIADAAGAGAWFDGLLAALQERATTSPLPERYGYYFDKTAWHWYVYPNLLHTGPDAVRGQLASRGLPNKPIWVTEMGVPIWSEHPGPCWDPTSPWRATTAEAAAYVWQSFAEGCASDVETMMLFQAYDDCGNGPTSYDAFGTIRNHRTNQCWVPPGHACWAPDDRLYGVPRPAFDAATWVNNELGEAELLWRPPQAAPRWQRLLFYRPPDTRVTVAWNWYRASQPVDLTATGRSGVLLQLDADGWVTSTDVVPESGVYSITLPGSTNRNNPGNQAPVMAGHPVMLVERDVYAPFRATIEPLPALSPVSFELIVSAADGGTGVASVRVYVAENDPDLGGTWRPLTDEAPWPEPARGGRLAVPFTGQPGRSYWFSATAQDRAGNVTALPIATQAQTRIDDHGGTAAASATSAATVTQVPVATATATDVSTTTPGVVPTAAPSMTPAGPPWQSTVVLPMVRRAAWSSRIMAGPGGRGSWLHRAPAPDARASIVSGLCRLWYDH